MAQLTSDIVWLVEQELTLADGSTQKVLVPQVYVRVKEGDIDGSGALLAGSNVNLHLAGDLTTEGGTIAGDDVALAARQDIGADGGSIDAQSSLTAAAGRDINVVTTTREAASDTGKLFGSDAASGVKLAAITRDRVAGLYVTNPRGSLLANAGHDLKLVGAEVKSEGDASLSPGRDMNLASVTTSRTAQPFFARHGFLVVEQRLPVRRGVVIPNALMRKTLAFGTAR